jgi:hypothetical protein
MFHVYPSSHDKVGLRDDMESLISVQNQRFHDWTAIEKAERLRKKAELFNADIGSDKVVYAFMKGLHSGNETESEDEDIERQEKIEVEKEVLETIASTAEVWEKKKGVGIVNVFANEERGSSPVISEHEEVGSVLGSDG